MTSFRTNKRTGKVFPIRGNVTIRAPKKGYISFSNKKGDKVVLKNPIKSKGGVELYSSNIYSSKNMLRSEVEEAVSKGADLKGVYLEEADLKGAYLVRADLEGADLKGADLEGAYLRGAYLGGADLRNTVVTKQMLKEDQYDENTKFSK